MSALDKHGQRTTIRFGPSGTTYGKARPVWRKAMCPAHPYWDVRENNSNSDKTVTLKRVS